MEGARAGRRPGGDTPQGASLRALRVQVEIEENIDRVGGLGERKRKIDRRARGRAATRLELELELELLFRSSEVRRDAFHSARSGIVAVS